MLSFFVENAPRFPSLRFASLRSAQKPIDLSEVEKKVGKGFYINKSMFKADLMLISKNCQQYNPPESTYSLCATDLEKFVKKM